MTTGPGYDAVVMAHALAAVVGFGALGATGAYAAALGRDPGRAEDGPTRRFFRPGRNWASRAVLLVPVLGGILLALGHGEDVGRAFPWVGLGLWTVAVTIASAVLWPAEREIQRLLADGSPPAPSRLRAACRRCERAAAATSLLFAVALVVMIAQP